MGNVHGRKLRRLRALFSIKMLQSFGFLWTEENG
jgi:hypothetical protein